MQGIGPFTMERAAGGGLGYGPILDDFASRGFVTFRVDKPGCGDSEGAPLKDVDFETQLDGFRAGLAALRENPDVDRDRILVFGHSMGGVWGPLAAIDHPVLGIAVYGTIAKTWDEYTLENCRRQSALAGSDAASIDTLVRHEASVNHYICVERLSPAEVRAQHTELAAWIDSTWVDATYYSGLHYDFVRQLASKNLAAAWTAFDGHALAVWGKSDFISSEGDHALIAQIVNARHPGRGEFLALDACDHGFCEAATFEESFAEWGKPGRPVNPVVVNTLREWSDRVIAGAGVEESRAR
jgi:pimeloyl-ACP methyl ester carboxylesterase